MPYIDHLKDVNNHNTFLALNLISSQFQGTSVIIYILQITSFKLLKFPGLPM